MTAYPWDQCTLEAGRSERAERTFGSFVEPVAMIRLIVPADPGFADILDTACRIYCRSISGGEELHDEVHATVTDAALGLLERAKGAVEIVIELDSGELRVTLAADGRSETFTFDVPEE
jgi:hypothetical protein